MKQQNKKLPALLAAVLLAASMPGNLLSYAAVPDAPSTTIRLPLKDGKASADAEVTGTIQVSIISVELPSDVEFNVYPDRTFAPSTPGIQIDSPSGLKVTNHSLVPVLVEVSRVEEGETDFVPVTPGGPEQTFHLVDKIAKTQELGRAVLVLGEAGKQFGSEADFEQYAIYPEMKQPVPVTKIDPEESQQLQIYGKVSADFYGKYRFTVKPTLKISAAGA